jgi:hypothetical protein
MNDLYKNIVGYEKITRMFGRWPSFHDAEVISVSADRDEGKDFTAPVITVVIHLFDLNVAPNDPQRNNTLTKLRFRGVEDFKISDFNHQNAISALVISREYSERLKSEVYNVEFKKGFGMFCSFQCSNIEIVSIESFVPLWGAWADQKGIAN